jgi:hypothetical protein
VLGGISRLQFIDRRFSTILALACLFCGGCGSVPQPLLFRRSPADRAIQEDDIRESVFRYRVEYPKRNGPFFLSIDGKDPSDMFMRRFAALKTTVKKASECYFKKEPFPGWLRDRFTHQEAIVFSVGPISWISLDRVEVLGGMYCGGLCADWGIYRLRKKNGRWVVDNYEVQAVS